VGRFVMSFKGHVRATWDGMYLTAVISVADPAGSETFMIHKSGMVVLTFMSIKTADGKQNFKTCFYFLNLEFSSLSSILQTLSALHAIRGFRMPFALKGI
jgi:hypothetical protein